MEWLKLELKIIRSQEYLASDPVARATWLNLICFCADKENGGVIEGCKAWKCRMWQQVCGITLAETRIKCHLYGWAGKDLVVNFYPTKTEGLVQMRREAGKAGAISRWQKKDVPLAKENSANAEQSRAEETRGEKSRAEATSAEDCRVLDWEGVETWLDLTGTKAVPDRQRAESLAREFLEEMEANGWRLKNVQQV